jgi:hypothetical protein
LESRPHRQGITRTTLALKKKVVKSGTSSPLEEFMFGIGIPELLIIMVIILTAVSIKDQEGPVTELVGKVRDQAELSGILETLYEAHFTLLSVEMLGAENK